MALRRYSGGRSGPLVLAVPRHDGATSGTWRRMSAVRRCLAAGACAARRAACPGASVCRHAERLLLRYWTRRRPSARAAPALLGGLFASIFATLHYERVQARAPRRPLRATAVLSAMVADLGRRPSRHAAGAFRGSQPRPRPACSARSPARRGVERRRSGQAAHPPAGRALDAGRVRAAAPAGRRPCHTDRARGPVRAGTLKIGGAARRPRSSRRRCFRVVVTPCGPGPARGGAAFTGEARGEPRQDGARIRGRRRRVAAARRALVGSQRARVAVAADRRMDCANMGTLTKAA